MDGEGPSAEELYRQYESTKSRGANSVTNGDDSSLGRSIADISQDMKAFPRLQGFKQPFAPHRQWIHSLLCCSL